MKNCYTEDQKLEVAAYMCGYDIVYVEKETVAPQRRLRHAAFSSTNRLLLGELRSDR